MPGIEGAHEKGGVEGEVGRFRRNHLVPQRVEALTRRQGREARGRLPNLHERAAVDRPADVRHHGQPDQRPAGGNRAVINLCKFMGVGTAP